jgi:hypothetical protein
MILLSLLFYYISRNSNIWPQPSVIYNTFSWFLLVLLFLFIKRYNLFKVLASSITFFHPSLFCATFFQLLKFVPFIPFKTSSSQRSLGLPIGLVLLKPIFVKVKVTLVQALRLCTGRTAHRGRRGIAVLYRHWGSVQAVRPIGGVEI